MPTLRRVRLIVTRAAKDFLGERASLRDFLKDSLVDQIEELRHHGERGDVALAQGPQQFGRIQSFQINDARAFHQRQKQIRHLRQHVKHGQHTEQRVGRPDIHPVEHRFHFTQKVGVRQHHALGIGGGSRGVEQGSDVVRCGGRGLELSRPAIENRRQISQPVLMDGVVRHAVRVHQHEADLQVRDASRAA